MDDRPHQLLDLAATPHLEEMIVLAIHPRHAAMAIVPRGRISVTSFKISYTFDHESLNLTTSSLPPEDVRASCRDWINVGLDDQKRSPER